MFVITFSINSAPSPLSQCRAARDSPPRGTATGGGCRRHWGEGVAPLRGEILYVLGRRLPHYCRFLFSLIVSPSYRIIPRVFICLPTCFPSSFHSQCFRKMTCTPRMWVRVPAVVSLGNRSGRSQSTTTEVTPEPSISRAGDGIVCGNARLP